MTCHLEKYKKKKKGYKITEAGELGEAVDSA